MKNRIIGILNAIIILLFLILSPLPLRAETPSGQFELTTCPFTLPPGETIQCSYLVVPEQHRQPDYFLNRLFLSLMEEARGRVWLVETAGERPEGDLTLISSMQLAHTTQYRVLGAPSGSAQARPTEPNLEDGYIWLMQSQAAQPALPEEGLH